jgi:hypothetical protein
MTRSHTSGLPDYDLTDSAAHGGGESGLVWRGREKCIVGSIVSQRRGSIGLRCRGKVLQCRWIWASARLIYPARTGSARPPANLVAVLFSRHRRV